LESKLGIDKNRNRYAELEPEPISRTGTGTGIDTIQTIPNPRCGPTENVGSEVRRNEQTIRRASAGAGLVLCGGPYSLLDLRVVTLQGAGRMGSDLVARSSFSRDWRDKASGLT